MPPTKPIWIACPQYRRLVRGRYECDERRRYRLGPGGRFVLGRAACGQLGGRCMETLCALHRHNRRGPGTWYPDRLLAAPEPLRRTKRRASDPPHAGLPGGGYLA